MKSALLYGLASLSTVLATPIFAQETGCHLQKQAYPDLFLGGGCSKGRSALSKCMSGDLAQLDREERVVYRIRSSQRGIGMISMQIAVVITNGKELLQSPQKESAWKEESDEVFSAYCGNQYVSARDLGGALRIDLNISTDQFDEINKSNLFGAELSTTEVEFGFNSEGRRKFRDYINALDLGMGRFSGNISWYTYTYILEVFSTAPLDKFATDEIRNTDNHAPLGSKLLKLFDRFVTDFRAQKERSAIGQKVYFSTYESLK